MSDHEQINELLPLYVSGKLADEPRRAVADHLRTCAECQADLEFWRAVAGEVTAADRALAAPAGLAEKALRQVRAQPRRSGLLRRAARLLLSQAPLVRRELHARG